jgi:glycerol uptake facilitator-like aquaporin
MSTNAAAPSAIAPVLPEEKPRTPEEGGRGGPRPLPLSYAGCEFLLTTSLLFCVVTAVRWLRDPASDAYIAGLRPALVVLAGLTAVLLVTLILSPPGRRSGGHMNPAVTIALWLMDVFPGARSSGES